MILGTSLLAVGLPVGLPGAQSEADAAPVKRCQDKFGTSPKEPARNTLPGYKPAGPNQWQTPDAEQLFYDFEQPTLNVTGINAPADVAKYGTDTGKYKIGTPEHAYASWNSRQASNNTYKGPFADWLQDVYIENNARNRRGGGFEREVARYFDLGGVNWLCETYLRDFDPQLDKELRQKLGDKVVGPNGRRFDAVDPRTKTVYEFKSGIDPKPKQLKVDAELVRRGWRVVYIHGQEPTDKVKAQYRAAGINYYRHGATPAPYAPGNQYKSRFPGLMTANPAKPSTGAGNDLISRSMPTPEDVRRRQEAARPFQQNTKNALRGPGGVDFTSLELRYVGQNETGSLNYSFSAKNTDEDENPGFGGMEKAQMASDSFFTWLALTPEKFWVNLNPDEPDRIMDRSFGKTDAGRVLLDADLEMKHDFSRAMDPKTPAGAEFWKNLTHKDNRICLHGIRNWITPQPAKVREQDGGIFILDAPLKVNSVPQETKTQPPGEQCRLTEAEIQHNQALVERLLVPIVEKKIAEGPAYADLRRVYASRVAAEWIKQQDAKKPGEFHKIIGSDDASRWPIRGAKWDSYEVWKNYRKSFMEGDYKYEYKEGEYVYTLTVGGVDFSKSPKKNITRTQFNAEKPNLSDVTKGSRAEVLGYKDSPTTLLGGDTAVRKSPPKPSPSHPTPSPSPTKPGDPSTPPPSGTPGPSKPGGDSGGTGGNGPGGDLAHTGSDTPIGLIAGIAALLAAAGGALLWWKRGRSGSGQH
ncbi:LPXTG cell wall anchor domain-containing protein [Streptomyces sp. SKN60]|uniref:LPXTG cell wall anchor domain-containing protein n=1 Tax=Streptomyces sp. SKN60 TaxID=2855506 RepID=UPI00224823CC|nr:LPXTG cell wall anchor domain-containing protein [Streptomyces sp. SKN60]MCX2181699.1 LPXTG cell wall anchor domain-containing protein [Streptomyces sp. SKN60]